LKLDLHNIEFENKSGVARITLNRPPLNVLDIATMKEINQVVQASAEDKTVRVLVIAARGRAFSGGVDVADHTPDKVDEMTAVFDNMCSLVINYPQPTLAVLNGHALGGGCELAISCDMIIASESAKIGQPEIKLGVFPPIAVIILPRLVGRKKAMEMILMGELIDAWEAHRIGLANQVVPANKLDEAAGEMIRKLSGLSAAVLRYTKMACYRSFERDYDAALKTVEDIYLHKLMKTGDAVEGLNSFMQKRPPAWTNS
jgi:cyclohexa-1,5-dienecarbonyl-CoA hydratase